MSMCCWELFWSPLEFITRNSHLWRYSGRMHSPWALYMYDSDFMFLSITWHDYCYSFCGANGKLSRHFIRLWAGQRQDQHWTPGWEGPVLTTPPSYILHPPSVTSEAVCHLPPSLTISLPLPHSTMSFQFVHIFVYVFFGWAGSSFWHGRSLIFIAACELLAVVCGI